MHKICIEYTYLLSLSICEEKPSPLYKKNGVLLSLEWLKLALSCDEGTQILLILLLSTQECLCQVWLKFGLWFWTRFLNKIIKQMYFLGFCYYLPLKRSFV